MNNTKANNWLFRKKTKDITFSYEIKQKGRFIKGSLIAVILGLVLGGIIIAAQNVNPFIYLKELFNVGFSGLFVDQTIQWLCIYIIAALAVGIGFKSGMFNIGVSGQMLMGSGISIIVFKLAVVKDANMNAGWIILMFLICAGSGAIFAGIAGALKALFNIHEVVTTIMLNWTAWYLMKYLFTTFQKISGDGIQSSGSIPSGALTIHGSSIAIPIIIAVIAVVVISVILAKTTFGFKLKSVGASPNASKYAGYNVKAKMIEAMVMSGTLAGIAAFINIFTITPNITFSVDTLPGIGYDSIAITLIAFNNPIGTVFSSFLWAVLQSGGSSAASLFNLPTQTYQLIFGVIVYFAAISVVFINWYPILKLRIMIALSGSKASQLKIKNLRKEMMKCREQLLNINSSEDVKEYKKFIQEQINEQKKLLNDSSKTPQEKEEIKSAIKGYKNDMNAFVKETRKNLKEEIKKYAAQIKVIKSDNYVTKINSAKEGIDRREFNTIRDIEQDAITKTSLIKSRLLSYKDQNKKELKNIQSWLKDQLAELKKEYKLKLNQNAVWFESETGIKNHYWEMRNGKIEAKAKIAKIKIDSHNEILNIKSDYQMDKMAAAAKTTDKEALKATDQKLLADMKTKIANVKAKENADIKAIRDHVAELTRTYKDTKKVNEAEQKRILADKQAVAIKEKEISEILDVWDNNLATLVDIKLAYKLKNEQVKAWYWKEKENIYNTYKTLWNGLDWAKADQSYAKVTEALKEYKAGIKALGNDNTLEIIAKKEKLLKEFNKTVHKVWKEKFAKTDNTHWTKVRYNIYNYIEEQKAELEKIAVVIKAHEEILDVEAKAKWIRKQYNDNIKTYKATYLEAKKVNVVKAQENYHRDIERFISKLEHTNFKKVDLERKVK